VTRPAFDKSTMPSRHVTEGTFAAPQRAFYYAMGLEADDIHRPLVGVVGAWDGASAASDAPLLVAEAVESGVTAGGATPRRFATVADGSARSLISRELVADTVELTVRGHSYDAIVGVGASWPAIAGLMMVACRLDVPAVIVPLASAALGSHDDDFALAAAATAVGLAPATEAGLSTAGMLESGRRAGRRVAELLRAGGSARSLVTAESLHDGAVALAGAGAQPDLAAHLVAVAAECGIGLDLEDLVGAMRTIRPDIGWVSGTLAPDGAPVAGGASRIRAAAQVFDDEAAACGWLARHGWPSGVAVVVRFQGPRGGPGLRSLDDLAAAAATAAPSERLLVTDGRVPAIPGVTAVSAAGPEAADGGPLALLRDGDALELDRSAGRIDVLQDVSGRAAVRAAPRELPRSWSKYARMVGPVRNGAVTHPGAGAEVIRYADF